jgi:ElaB/YqjD/DUF883 family membrane-anchored ribosome-binding protein
VIIHQLKGFTMFSSKTAVNATQDAVDQAADVAAQWADNTADAVSRSHGAAIAALGTAQQRLSELGDKVLPTARQFASQAQDMATKGIDAARYGGQQVRDVAVTAAERSKRYVKDEPVKSIAIAALAGVAVYAIVRALNQSKYGR